MASALTSSRDTSGHAGSTARDLLVQYNALVTVMDALCAKLDADVGVTGTDYAATLSDTLSRIGDMSGTEITA